jgi:hypothetical protein
MLRVRVTRISLLGVDAVAGGVGRRDVICGGRATSGDSPKCRDQADVADRVGELGSPGRLKVRQQVELATVLGPVMQST